MKKAVPFLQGKNLLLNGCVHGRFLARDMVVKVRYIPVGETNNLVKKVTRAHLKQKKYYSLLFWDRALISFSLEDVYVYTFSYSIIYLCQV